MLLEVYKSYFRKIIDKLEFLLYNKHTIEIAILLSGLVGRPWSTEWRGISPLFLLYFIVERGVILSENILSVFIDESGDFGPYEHHSPYYIVSMVLHEQSKDIGENISGLDNHIHNLGYDQHVIHVGPLIRREQNYRNELMEDRKRLFNALFHFARKLPVSYICAKVKKSECPDVVDITTKLSKSISRVLREHFEYFENFEKIIVYYDNGQVELTKILTTLFNALLSNVEFRRVKPSDYKLFQVADLVCTLELLNEKVATSAFTNSEREFFHSERDFKRNNYKYISKKHI